MPGVPSRRPPRTLRRAGGAAVLLLGLLTAGCSVEVPGTATTASPPAATPVPTAAAAAPREPAPRELDVAEICALLTEDQQRELGITPPGRPGMKPTRDPQCEWRTPQLRVAVSHAANGFSVDDIPPAPGAEVTEVEIAGLRALMLVDPAAAGGCTLYVELTPASYLAAEARALPAGPADACGVLRTAAGYAVGNLGSG